MMTFFLGELASLFLYTCCMLCVCGAALAIGEDKLPKNKLQNMAVVLFLGAACGWIITRYAF
jgi:Na+/citrate or Na+/malate symporter